MKWTEMKQTKPCVFIYFSWACSQGLTNLPKTFGENSGSVFPVQGWELVRAGIEINIDWFYSDFHKWTNKGTFCLTQEGLLPCPIRKIQQQGPAHVSAPLLHGTLKNAAFRFPPWHPPTVEGQIGQQGSVAVWWSPMSIFHPTMHKAWCQASWWGMKQQQIGFHPHGVQRLLKATKIIVLTLS